MLLNAFKCDNGVYSIQLSDIGVADAGDDVLYVYCRWRTDYWIGVFESVDAA